jgi:predicted transcriptional regulator YdeE
MNFVQLEHFAVVGIEVRTSNAREMTPDGVIGPQWERFAKENLAARIPRKAEPKPTTVYSDYASDENGEYNYLLGAKVSAIGEIPAGMVVRNVPTGRYAVFTSEPGPAAKVVYETWKRIWAEPRTPEYTRSYRADFEKYLEDGRVEIYIGVKD